MNPIKRGIYLIIFCLPLYLIRFEIFKIPTTALELLIYVLFVLWLINKGYKGLWEALKYERLLVWGILLLLLGVSMATLFSWDLRLSAGIWKAWFIDPILFFMVFITAIKKEDIKKVFDSLILSGLVVAIISLIYLICGNLNYQGRLQGIFNSPNYLAMYLAVPLILCLSRKRVLYLVSCILFLITLFFTKSFGVLFGLVGAVGFGLIVYLYQKNKKKIALGVLVFGFALIFILGLWKIQSLEGLKSFDARFVIWERAINAFLENPITGIGPGTFEYYFPPYPKWGVPQPHNVFLAFLIQTGLIGFVGLVLLLIWFYKNNAKNLALLCSMTYILAHGLVDTTYWKNDLSVIFWAIIGIAAILQFYRIKQPVSLVDEE